MVKIKENDKFSETNVEMVQEEALEDLDVATARRVDRDCAHKHEHHPDKDIGSCIDRSG